ncbi:MAG: L-threonylcarbamoyladenylate synthase [Eubacteriales bacterium]
MNTKIFTEKEIKQASSLLKQGELLGFPTETVYGLAANGLSIEAVKKIYEAKGRPSDNPLILHIASSEWMTRYCTAIPAKAWVLAERFWPGPLTLILPAKNNVPEIVRGGLSTVGLRCPKHPLALALLEETDFPLAAPSGNLSGKPSPTSVQAMLEDMDGKISGILDGGDCVVGVESTILTFLPEPCLLRAGGVGVESLEAVLGEKIFVFSEKTVDKPMAPGMKYRHYAPKAKVTVVQGKDSAQWIANHMTSGEGVICFQEYEGLFQGFETQKIGKETDFTTQAKAVFSALRYFDSSEVSHIWAQCPEEKDLGLAVANRLQKASGFQIVKIAEEESE